MWRYGIFQSTNSARPYPRAGWSQRFEKHFETSSRPKEAAIDNAHLNWNIKKAAKAGDVETVKQLTDKPTDSWADLKFKGQG